MARAWEKAKGGSAEIKMTVLDSLASESRISGETEAAGRWRVLMVGAVHELDEHVGGELVGLIAGGDADDGELLFTVGARREEREGRGGVGGLLLLVIGELGYQLADAEEEEVAADLVEIALVTVVLD